MLRFKKVITPILILLFAAIVLQGCATHYCPGVQGTGNYASSHHKR